MRALDTLATVASTASVWGVREWSAAVAATVTVGGLCAAGAIALFEVLLLRTVRRRPADVTGLFLDALGARHEETKGFLDRLYKDERAEQMRLTQVVSALSATVETNKSRVHGTEKLQIQHGNAIERALDGQRVIERLNDTLSDMTDTLRVMGERLARIEGYIEGPTWDKRDRRTT